LSRNNSIREVVLASSGNQSIYASGQALYTTPTNFRSNDSIISVLPGQYVFVNTDTGLSVGPEATKANTPNIAIGLGVDTNDDGISDYIRWAYDSISGCGSVVGHTASPSQCGVPPITDLFFGCIECGQTYTIEVHVTTPETNAFGIGPNGSEIYSFSYTPSCGDCSTGDCPETTVSADQVMCGLYNVIKGIHVDPNWDIRLNGFPFDPTHEYPFEVAKLYNADGSAHTTFEYCLTETDGECIDCVNLSDVGGAASATGSISETFSPATWVTENEVKVSKRAHIERAVSLITAALDGNGSAVYIPPTGACCTNHKIEVNTCLTDFLLKDGDNTNIAVCGSSNPFSAITNYNECQDCDNDNTTTTYTAGLRFYGLAAQGACDCLPGNQTLVEYFSEIRVFPKFGFADGGSKTVERQTQTLAEGQGYYWQTRELQSLRPYTGQDFHWANWGGKYGSPNPTDALSNITTNCRDSYCVIAQRVAPYAASAHSIAGERYFPKATAYFLIPQNDSTTRTSFLATYNAYFAASGDCALASLSCSA
jgi:hypothetical protein